MKHIFTPIATTVHAALLESEGWAASWVFNRLYGNRGALHRKAMAVVVYDRALCHWWRQIID